MVDEQADALPRFGQVREHRRLQGILATACPKAVPPFPTFAAAVATPPLAGAAPWLSSSLLNADLPPPGDVLRSVVRKNLFGRTVRGDRRPQHFQHQAPEAVACRP